MPRNPSTGVYSKPAGTTPSVGQLIDPVPWNALTTDLGNEITNSLPRDGSAPMVAPIKAADGSAAAPGVGFASNPSTGIHLKAAGVGALVASGVEIANWSASGLTVTGAVSGGVKYATKNANYTAVAADAGTVFRFTAAATLTLAAAATLGAGWPVTVVADGGGVTIDPVASETINGLATLIVKNGSTAEIVCDGTNFFTILRTQPWEMIGDFTVAALSASLSVTDLSAYRKLRISSNVTPSATAQFFLRTSTNNGSSYDSGATDYTWQVILGRTSSVTAGSAQAAGVALFASTPDASSAATFEVIIENFNKAAVMQAIANSFSVSGALTSVGMSGGARVAATARNALQILPASGTFSGQITVEGIRG